MNNFVGGIVALTVAIIVATQVLIPQLVNTNTSGWDASSITLWSTLTLFVVLGLLYGIGGVFGIL